MLVKIVQKQLSGLLVGVFLATALAACGTPNTQAPTTGTATPAATATSSDSGATAQDVVTETTTAASDSVTTTETASDTTAVTMAKLNLNTVTEDELLSTIPGFGNRMVREFMEYRPYVSIQQFRREIGKYVDEAQVSEYEKYVYVPINVNEADADTLMQIPGVDATAADTLMAARPYADNGAFLAKLAEVAPAVDGIGAESYLEAQ